MAVPKRGDLYRDLYDNGNQHIGTRTILSQSPCVPQVSLLLMINKNLRDPIQTILS